MSTKSKVIVGIAVALVLAVGGFWFGRQQQSSKVGAAGLENYIPAIRAGGFQLSDTGTGISSIITGTCTFDGLTTAHTSSTTKAYSCPITNLTSSFNIVMVLSSTTATTTALANQVGPFSIVAARSSSTAGYAEALIKNDGITITPSQTGIASSTAYWAWKTF